MRIRPAASAPALGARRVPARRSRPRAGVALLVVLGCLVFLSALVLAFLGSVSMELQSSQSFANASSVKLVSDSAVNIVLGQLQDATRSIDAASNQPLTWASQPGMIRTYQVNGQPGSYYKLFSSDTMVGSGAFDPAGDLPPADWVNAPAVYTDLNEPIYKKGVATRLFPIVDPAAVGSVKGFSIAADAPVSLRDTAPMPVKWMYLLQDGSVAASSGAGSVANIPSASSDNPMVARIAFWTDDDSSKVNINTAAGDIWVDSASPPALGSTGNPGSFWDLPRNFSDMERLNLAKYQPAQDEFQRYPGHPATTCLSAVFPSLTSSQLYQITPRVTAGGSLSGTVLATTAIAADTDRLYASEDELLFAINRQQNPPLSADAVRRSTFFLTAHSRSPELNLFSKPRVLLWPVHATGTPAFRTAHDNLIAHCGTLNGSLYYFERSNSRSNTVDLPAAPTTTGVGRNRALITYLRNLTAQPIPGFSPTADATFLKKYSKDRDQILTEMFDYIRSLNAQDTSTTGLSAFTTTLTNASGQGQILPIVDTSHSDSNSLPLRGYGRFPTVRSATLLFAGVGQTQGALKSIPPQSSQGPADPIADGNTRMQAVLLLTFFDPSQNFGATVPNFKVRVSGANAMQWISGGKGMGFPTSGTVSMTKNYDTGVYGGYRGTAIFALNGGIMTAGAFPFISGYADMPTGGVFNFYGSLAPIKVELLDSTGAIVVQTLTMTFPDGTFPVPALAPYIKDPGDAHLSQPAMDTDMRDFTKRFAGAAVNSSSLLSKTYICGKDVVRSVEVNTDPRLIAAMETAPSSCFAPIQPQYSDATVRQVHAIYECSNGTGAYPFVGAMLGRLVTGADYGATIPWTAGDLAYAGILGPPDAPGDGLQVVSKSGGVTGKGTIMPVAFTGDGGGCWPVNGVTSGSNTASGSAPGDWDTGFATSPDGAFINKADEGVESSAVVPYFTGLTGGGIGSTFFSPNRQMPSAVMFGSLPTGVGSNRPWQTLLFRPDPGGSPQHIGATTPPDYLLLDLFTMPIVEPYAISDPFSTAGKINMNCQIIPFTYITRETGLQAVLRSEQPLAMADADANKYKLQAGTYPNHRSYLNIDETLNGFRQRFGAHDLFRSESEICSLWLVPQGQTYAGMPLFWSDKKLTGDNVREKPYADIYPRLTTRSNTYTVHYRVQTLKKTRRSPMTQWNEASDLVTGDYRGSSVIERYLDTSDTTIPDYATVANPAPIDNFYKMRVIETKQFLP